MPGLNMLGGCTEVFSPPFPNPLPGITTVRVLGSGTISFDIVTETFVNLPPELYNTVTCTGSGEYAIDTTYTRVPIESTLDPSIEGTTNFGLISTSKCCCPNKAGSAFPSAIPDEEKGSFSMEMDCECESPGEEDHCPSYPRSSSSEGNIWYCSIELRFCSCYPGHPGSADCDAESGVALKLGFARVGSKCTSGQTDEGGGVPVSFGPRLNNLFVEIDPADPYGSYSVSIDDEWDEDVTVGSQHITRHFVTHDEIEFTIS